MKTFLLSFLLLTVHPDSTAWVYEEGINVTFMEVNFDWGKSCVFMLDGFHVGEISEMVKGCILTPRSARMIFPDIKKYVKRSDQDKIKTSLNIKTLCTK